MDTLKELIKNKTVTGVTLSLLVVAVLIYLFVTNGIIGLPLYIMIGLIGLFGIIITIYSIISNKKEPITKNTTIENKYANIVEYIEGKNLDVERCKLYLKTYYKEKYSLLKHPLFGSSYREMNYVIDNLDIPHKGKCWVISNFLRLKLETVVTMIKSYIEDNQIIIEDDFEHLNIDGVITLIYDSINGKSQGAEGYETLALKMGIPEHFITHFNKVHDYVVYMLKFFLETIKKSPYFINDYERFASVLNVVEWALKETFTKRHIDDILAINGTMNEKYDEIKDLIDKKYLS